MYNYITIKKVEKPNVTIHCVQSPETGEMTNAQIIETANKLLLIDTLQLKPHADELRQYVDSLGKPLELILISHGHPDHWLGGASFADHAVSSFPEIIGALNYSGDYLLNFHKTMHPENPELIHDQKHIPTLPVEPGVFDFDGVSINLIKVLETESAINMVVELPELHTLVAQDLVYNKTYAFFGDRTASGDYGIDNWVAALETFQQNGYTDVIPGHGDPTDASVFAEMIGYLQFVKGVLLEGLTSDDLVKAIKKQYPDYRLPLTLMMSNFMLFGTTVSEL